MRRIIAFWLAVGIGLLIPFHDGGEGRTSTVAGTVAVVLGLFGWGLAWGENRRLQRRVQTLTDQLAQHTVAEDDDESSTAGR